MIQFSDDKSRLKLAQLRTEEEENFARLLGEKYGIPYADLSLTPINSDALRLVSEEVTRTEGIAIFDIAGKRLSIATRSPQNIDTSKALAELASRGYTFKPYIVSGRSLETAWKHYKELSYARKSKAGSLEISSEDIAGFAQRIHNLKDATAFITETLGMQRAQRISRIVEVFVASAIGTKASDIHIEPQDGDVRLRFRLDGILTDILAFDHDTYNLLLSRVKLLSGLKLNIKKEAQDGRFSITMGEQEVEIRTSVLPGEYGESIVMRILDPSSLSTPFGELGMEQYMMSIMDAEIRKPNGMIINTGPTGSGKTTTLYALLKKVHSPDVKIITIEDPIEYHLAGVVQTQVEPKKNYTFATGLRAALRQDPDVIMVGEIRDKETAEIAIHAALTGHLVFTTLHTNNAAGTFPRLIDIGIDAKIIGSAVNIAMAQRLVRKLCEVCRQEVPLEEVDKQKLAEIIASIPREELKSGVSVERVWKPSGQPCETCGGVGYKGRVGIFEGVLVDADAETLLRQSPGEREIAALALKQKMLTMRQDGVLKVLRGTTSLDELRRVVDIGW